MQEMLNHILVNYTQAKTGNFGGHAEANYIRENTKTKIEEQSKLDVSKYKVEGSPGKGNWADIPWLGVFDREITTTATKGYDIVYLFRSDMSGVYISLNQGWTYFKDKYGVKEGKNKIRLVSDAWRNILASPLNDFTFDKIDLRGTSKISDLAEGYELGHICGKFYERDNIPSNDVLIEDLRNLLGVYRELKGYLIENSTEKTNNYLIVNQGLRFFDKEDDRESIDNAIENAGKSSSLIVEAPPIIMKISDSFNFTPKHIDFLKKAKNQKKLGLAGELMVLKFERDRHISNGNKPIADRVKHISEECGDGAGYDILSYDENGFEKYIEVKTTTGPIDTPFLISSNELSFSQLHSESFYLYRVFDYDKEKNEGKLYIIRGDLSEHLCLKAQQYIATGISSVPLK